jgi:GNAT superfamily N-acetyltransferase
MIFKVPESLHGHMGDAGSDHQETEPNTEPLTADDAHRLRLGWTSRFDRSDIRNLVSRHPGLSHWIPKSGEYVIAGPWRHREEVSSVLELSGRENAASLLRRFAQASQQSGKRVALMSEHQERRDPRLYKRARFDLIEHIMIYELPRIPEIDTREFRLSFREMPVLAESNMDALLELDHESFPWLWWNSRDEFLSYGRAHGVKIYGGFDASGQLISYIGVTRFRAWGHLDRIAVRPDLQGRGIGLESLEFAIHVLAAAGARRIGLSTQARNERSRLLYERYGFRRSPQQDYYLYGRWLHDDAAREADV